LAVNPPPAHSLAHHPGLPRSLRASIAATVVGVIVAGQLLANGDFYFENFAGISFGLMACVVKFFALFIEPGLAKSLFPAWVLISLFILPLASCYICLILGLGVLMVVGVRRQIPAMSAKVACLIFTALALLTQAGFLVSRTASFRNFLQCTCDDMEVYFIYWPVFFVLVAAYHAVLFRQARAAQPTLARH
jgi:hypothetical protein